jgi:hypothetical protein
MSCKCCIPTLLGRCAKLSMRHPKQQHVHLHGKSSTCRHAYAAETKGACCCVLCQKHVAHRRSMRSYLPLDSAALAWQLRMCPSVQGSPACCCEGCLSRGCQDARTACSAASCKLCCQHLCAIRLCCTQQLPAGSNNERRAPHCASRHCALWSRLEDQELCNNRKQQTLSCLLHLVPLSHAAHERLRR